MRLGQEPPSLVEYSNSTGAVLACRPAASSSGRPVALTWRMLTWQTDEQVGSHKLTAEAFRNEQVLPLRYWDAEEPSFFAPSSPGKLVRHIRRDGSLVIEPFARQLPLHSASYRCCLVALGPRTPDPGEPPGDAEPAVEGPLCSRPARLKPGKSP